MLCTEKLFRPVARQIFHHVGKLASAVITLARIALCVFVGKDRTRGFEHGFADEIFRGNQL